MSDENDSDGSGTSSNDELDSTVLCVCPKVPEELVAGSPKKPVSRAALAAVLYLVNTPAPGVLSARRSSTTRARSVDTANVMGAKVFCSAIARRMSWHAERRESSISESFSEELGNDNTGAAQDARIRKYEFIIAEGGNEVGDDESEAAAAIDAKGHAPVSGVFRRRTNGWNQPSVMVIVLVLLLVIVLYSTFFKI